ncbi:MAG: tetratricopeptide repeat protein [Anaerolineales bacterium]
MSTKVPEEPADTFIGVGEWIRRRRKALDLTQDELARQVGCSKVAIRKIESEERRPSKQIAERLADVLGIAADDRKAFIRFARGDPRAALPAQRARGDTPLPWQTQAGNLPLPPTPLVGREAELAELHHHILDPGIRLLTLIGPGGIGKTHLALQTALEAGSTFSGGTYFVPLAPLRSQEFIVSATASTLKLAFYGALEPKDQLLNYLKNEQILLVMDNFEHLMAGASLLTEILSFAPYIKILVTSRERLNLRGEWLFEVKGLSIPDNIQAADAGAFSAVQLFLQCARRVQPDFSLSVDENPTVIRICQLVEGLPLGIELAAVWVRALSCREIAAEIERNLEFLTIPRRDVSERHRSLKAVFEHSWTFLSEDERRVLQSLSVFHGGFEREAAEGVAGASLSVLAALVDKSLVRHSAAGRYEMHELLRQYGLGKLSEAGETESVHKRHRDWFLELAKQANPGELWGTAEEVWLKRLEDERDNLRAALAWSMQNGEAEDRLRLATLLVWFWYVQAHFTEGRQWLEQAWAKSEGASPSVRAVVLSGMGLMAMQQGLWEQATLWFTEYLKLYRGLNHVETGWVLMDLAQMAVVQGAFDRAAALFAECETIFESEGLKASVLLYQGIAAGYQGNYEQAKVLLDKSLPVLRKINDRLAIARALHALGIVMRHQDNAETATALFSEGLTISHAIGARLEIAQCLEGLAGLASAQAQLEKAARLFGVAEALRAAISTPLLPGIRADVDRDRSVLRAQLAEGVFEAAYADGRTMTMEQAITYAMEKPTGRNADGSR